MVFHPAIMALFVASILTAVMVLYSSFFGLQVIWGWNIKSGSEDQLIRERKTYLISTILNYLFAFQLLSLFLYVFTVDKLHTFFVGAMCASGSLYVNGYGYPALILKIVNFLLAGLWLLLNYTDNRAYDYPLITKKYTFLLVIAPLIIMESVLQAGYFLALRPNIITSCCGSFFSADAAGFSSGIAALPILPTMTAFFSFFGLTFASGSYFLLRRKGAVLFAALSGLTFLVSMAGIISFLSVYIYELPTHHCPFCLLQREYGYIGYLLYLSLFGATIMGMGAGILTPFHNIKSLINTVPRLQRTFVANALILFALFLILVIYKISSSNFILDGH